MNNRLFYNEKNKQKNLATKAAIYEVMAKYYQGVEEAKLNLLADVFHPSWAMRDNDVSQRDQINVEDKPTFIQRVRLHGPYKDYAADRFMADLNWFGEGWAFVQITKTTSGNSTLFFLLETEGGWLIIDKIWINTAGDPEVDMDSISEYRVIENLLHTYQDAIDSAHDQYLQQILDKEWDAKYLGEGKSLSEYTRTHFFKELALTKSDLSEITAIKLFQSKLAIAQASGQDGTFTSFFVLFYIEESWKMACERRVYHA